MTHSREQRAIVASCRKARQRVTDLINELSHCDTATLTPEETEVWLHGNKLLSAINHVIRNRWEGDE